MIEIIDERDARLHGRIAELIEQLENHGEQWHKLLIEKFVKQVVEIDTLMERMDALEKYQNFHSAVIDGMLLETPAFLRDDVEVKASNNLLPGEGFYNKETSSAGVDFRWTQRDFYFAPRSTGTSTSGNKLQLASAIKQELLEDIRCYADGTQIPLGKAAGEEGHVYRGTEVLRFYVH